MVRLGFTPSETSRYLATSRPLYRYGLALLLVCLSTALGQWLRLVTYVTPYEFFFPAILITLWLAGFGPGLLATVLSSLAADFLFIRPYYKLYGATADVLRSIYFVATFAIICWLIDWRQQKAEVQILHQAHSLQRVKDEQRLLEEQLRQAQKMEAVGRLAGGVAHDFNNLLTVIIGQAALLGMSGPSEEAQRRINEISAAANRATALTSQLLAFSRKQMMRMEPLDLNAVVQQFSSVLARLLGEDVLMDIVLEPLLGLILGDKNQIEQILMNLAVNSRDAMPDGGKFLIETARVVLDEQYVRTHAEVTPGQYIMLAVSDTGAGIPEESRAHIFEPFFTTKDKGKGTGLGLSMVYGTVKQMQGSIWAYSEVGQGTTFKLYFPLTGEELKTAPESIADASAGRLNLNVLVVEDNSSLLDLITDYLAVDGCTVITAGNEVEALRQSARFPGKIDVLLTDVILPGKNGKQIAAEIAAQRPDIKIVYASGYTANVIVHHGVLEEGVHFLQKPFTRAQLISIIRAAMREGQHEHE